MLAALLAGCGDPLPGSVKGGECKVFHSAAIEACGMTLADQEFIDDTIEGGVAACRWARPAARVPSCADLRAEIATLRAKAPPAPMKPKKKPFWKRNAES